MKGIIAVQYKEKKKISKCIWMDLKKSFIIRMYHTVR